MYCSWKMSSRLWVGHLIIYVNSTSLMELFGQALNSMALCNQHNVPVTVKTTVYKGYPDEAAMEKICRFLSDYKIERLMIQKTMADWTNSWYSSWRASWTFLSHTWDFSNIGTNPCFEVLLNGDQLHVWAWFRESYAIYVLSVSIQQLSLIRRKSFLFVIIKEVCRYNYGRLNHRYST